MTMTTRTSPTWSGRRLSAALLAGLTAVTVAACSESAQTRTCNRMDGVHSAIEDLRNVNVSENGMVALQAGLVQVSNQLDLLRSSLSADLQPQVDAVKTSVQQLQGAVQNARANPTPESLAAARNTLQGVRATIANLRTVVAATC
jgi:hypothetical protein